MSQHGKKNICARFEIYLTFFYRFEYHMQHSNTVRHWAVYFGIQLSWALECIWVNEWYANCKPVMSRNFTSCRLLVTRYAGLACCNWSYHPMCVLLYWIFKRASCCYISAFENNLEETDLFSRFSSPLCVSQYCRNFIVHTVWLLAVSFFVVTWFAVLL